MKYRNITIELDSNKHLVTNNLFKTIKEIKDNNKDVLLITPLTKISDILKISRSNVMFKIINELFDSDVNSLVNNESHNNLKNNINNLFDLDIVNKNMDVEKILKILIELNDVTIDTEVLSNIFRILDKYSDKKFIVITSGFEKIDQLMNHFYDKITIINLATNILDLNIKWQNLESLVLDTHEEVIPIYEKDKFKAWLEYKTKTVLTIKDIEEYFNNISTFNSYLIDRAIKNIGN